MSARQQFLCRHYAFLDKPLRWLRAISKYKARTSGGPNFAYELCLRQVSAVDKHDLDLSSWTLAFNGSETVRASTLNHFAAAFAECGFRHEAFYPCYGLAEATLLVSGPERGRGFIVKRFNKAALSQGLAIAEIDSLDENEGIVSCGQWQKRPSSEDRRSGNKIRLPRRADRRNLVDRTECRAGLLGATKRNRGDLSCQYGWRRREALFTHGRPWLCR